MNINKEGHWENRYKSIKTKNKKLKKEIYDLGADKKFLTRQVNALAELLSDYSHCVDLTDYEMVVVSEWTLDEYIKYNTLLLNASDGAVAIDQEQIQEWTDTYNKLKEQGDKEDE